VSPHCHRAAEQADELAPVHSITSSAATSSLSGMVRSNILAVEALITNSNLFDCTPASPPAYRRPWRIDADIRDIFSEREADRLPLRASGASTLRGLGNPPSSASKLFLVMRAPLVQRVGAIEVPPGTRARRTSSLFAPQ
jgi:hypothetical protein